MQAWAGRPPLILNHAAALSALAALPATFDRDRALAAWAGAGVSNDDGAALWEALDQAGLMVDSDEDPWWEGYDWREAAVYHRATRDYPFLQMDEREAFADDARRMESYGEEAPAPPLYQHLGADGAVALPRLGSGESPDERLRSLSADERRSLPGVGLLLDVCFGERGRIAVAARGNCLLKSIPSGGARHPTEVFLAAFGLPGVDAGVYHYDVEHHRLERLRSGQLREAFADATLDLFARHDDPPAALLVFTSLVERAMWRYRDPRSFRAVMVDVGHAVTAYRRAARALGFRTYAYQKMNDREVAELVGVDPIAQPPLYTGTLVR